jgi:hypothetical protein
MMLMWYFNYYLHYIVVIIINILDFILFNLFTHLLGFDPNYYLLSDLNSNQSLGRLLLYVKIEKDLCLVQLN